MPIASRLTSTGTLLVNGSLDEISLDAGSISFNGTSQYLTVPDDANLELGSSDFTIEMWIYPTSTAAEQILINKVATATVVGSFDIRLETNGAIRTLVATTSGTSWTNDTTSTLTVNFNQWNHVAFVRSGNVFTRYINGVSAGGYTSAITLVNEATTLNVGANGNGSDKFTGYMSNVRIVKGTAVYTAAFTPSQSILQPTTNTQLLLNVLDSTTFIKDDSTNKFTVTNVGTATWTAIGPFNRGNTSLKQRLVNDGTLQVLDTFDEVTNNPTTFGSVLFDGSTGYLTIPYNSNFNFNTGSSVSFEAWVYPTSYTNPMFLASRNWSYGGTGPTWGFRIGNATNIDWSIAGTGSERYVLLKSASLVSPYNIPLNSWTHVAFTRDTAGNNKIFVNGYLVAARADSQSLSSASGSIYIGIPSSGGNYSQGYISNLRLVSNNIPVSYQTSNTTVGSQIFTPPVQPLTAVSNTVLLLNTPFIPSSDTFLDSSTTNSTITKNGTLTSSSGTPFTANNLVTQRLNSTGVLQVGNIFDEWTGAPVADSNLQLWWDAGQTSSYSGSGSTFTDLSGKGNTGTLNGSPTFNSLIGGGTLLFDGISQTASITTLNLQQDFTLETWVNQKVLNGFAMFGQGTGAVNQGLHIWYTAAGTIRFGMFGNDTDFTVSTITGVWYHMVFTYNNSSPYTKGFYLNAVAQSGTAQQTQAAYSGSGVFRLGATYSSSGNYGNGYFQGAKVYNRILTADEVTTNFNALRDRYSI